MRTRLAAAVIAGLDGGAARRKLTDRVAVPGRSLLAVPEPRLGIASSDVSGPARGAPRASLRRLVQRAVAALLQQLRDSAGRHAGSHKR